MENKEKVDSEQKDPKEEGSTESDEEEQRGPDGEKKKRIMGPRKKFEWTDHVRFGKTSVLDALFLLQTLHYNFSMFR